MWNFLLHISSSKFISANTTSTAEAVNAPGTNAENDDDTDTDTEKNLDTDSSFQRRSFPRDSGCFASSSSPASDRSSQPSQSESGIHPDDLEEDETSIGNCLSLNFPLFSFLKYLMKFKSGFLSCSFQVFQKYQFPSIYCSYGYRAKN